VPEVDPDDEPDSPDDWWSEGDETAGDENGFEDPDEF
jgi:hypothetical protein